MLKDLWVIRFILKCSQHARNKIVSSLISCKQRQEAYESSDLLLNILKMHRIKSYQHRL